MARPSAPPIICVVFTRPEARPDCSGATSPIAASSSGLNASPAPSASRIIDGSTSVTYVPSTGARANQSRPAARNASPTTSGARMPKRITILAERPSEKRPMRIVAGRNARPTSSGL